MSMADFFQVKTKREAAAFRAGMQLALEYFYDSCGEMKKSVNEILTAHGIDSL